MWKELDSFLFCGFTLTRQGKKKKTEVEISGSVLVDVKDQDYDFFNLHII